MQASLHCIARSKFISQIGQYGVRHVPVDIFTTASCGTGFKLPIVFHVETKYCNVPCHDIILNEANMLAQKMDIKEIINGDYLRKLEDNVALELEKNFVVLKGYSTRINQYQILWHKILSFKTDSQLSV